MARMLVDGSISPKILDRNGQGLLTDVVLSPNSLHDKVNMLDFLLRAGACPDTKDKDGKNLMIHVAVLQNG